MKTVSRSAYRKFPRHRSSRNISIFDHQPGQSYLSGIDITLFIGCRLSVKQRIGNLTWRCNHSTWLSLNPPPLLRTVTTGTSGRPSIPKAIFQVILGRLSILLFGETFQVATFAGGVNSFQ